MAYALLLLAILSEVIATTALKASDSFTKLGPSVLSVVGYVISFYLLSVVMRTIPTGVAYAIWAGLGIVLVSIFGYLFANEKLDLAACIGMSLIIAGVVVMNIFSKTVGH
ncbi:SMR family transporter [Marinomonas sp. C2222]|uniref:SMR family transporter n=1 Tax=Marinomonas sargassi TaxID=2984494 RepID=A0ABT2YQL7_9GAMM|nr:SMR family transporter [Marinomonas sargassi]MCV2402151.1 SMR family transporter [Marinomonas sargassi]